MGDDYMKAEAKSPHTILDKAIALENAQALTELENRQQELVEEE